ncbi:MAG TPA: PDZ domain-containing protein [Verrucomicrobiae bacterium]|nr:PDZ domain-containing protein [Verrucomicrobiae bacterium]
MPYAAAAAVVCLLLVSPPASRAEIHYTVSLAHPEQHVFHVSVEIPDVKDDLKLQMAAWNALYQIRDFSSHVQRVQAFVEGKSVPIEKLDKLTWHVKGSGTVTVRYDTFWDDPGPFDSQLNEEHAFINPAMILLYVPERRAEKSAITLSDVPGQWRVASETLSGGALQGQTYLLQAASYDALADAPIEASKFEEFTLSDVTPTVRVVIHGDNWKRSDVEKSLRKIVTYEVKLMDGAPYDHYTFIFHMGKATNGAGGGMEHANCAAIYVTSASYLQNVAAHEFFHAWNVKRIRPASLEPVDFAHEMYTRALWFAEGVTNTYASYALVRTGLWSRREFYQDLSGQISELEGRPAEQWQSAEQSSLDAWLEKYALYNQPQRSVSYYTKGQVLGVLLDIVIRDRTDNQKSLDDVLRAMNREFAKEGKFYRDSLDIRVTAEKVSGAALEDFFGKYVSGAEPLPYTDLLARAGLELHQREIIHAAMGFTAERDPNGPWTVRSVDADGPAAKSGLLVGDEIVRWNNGEAPRRPERWLSQQKPGDTLHLRVRRDDKEQNIEIRLGEQRETFYQVAESANAGDRARRIREGILHGGTDPVTARNR